jgi:hypothetical protein
MQPIQDWGMSKYGAQIALTVLKRFYAPGETVALTIFLRRRDGAESLRIVNVGAWWNYALTLSSRRGEPVSSSRFGQLLEERLGREGERMMLDLDPGAVLITTLPLNALFDITVPDVYVLSVSRVVWVADRTDPDRLESNQTEIEVSEDAAALAGDVLLL